MPRSRLALVAAAVLTSVGTAAYAQDARPAPEIIMAIDAVKMPAYDPARRSEAGYVEAFLAEREAAFRTQADLIKELYEAYPDNEALVTLLPQRWGTLLNGLRDAQAVATETSAYLKSHKQGPLVAEAAYYNAAANGQIYNYDADHFMPAFDAFAKLAPGDERGAQLLMGAARAADSDDQAFAMYKRAVRDYPNARATRYAAGKIKQIEGLNKPFELEFTDAVSGDTITMKDLRGKVVVVDFWATWCGPCVAEMPHMKELYAEYKDKGVEFVGISLDAPEDQGGLDKLRAFVDERAIGWPQYYQGAGWDSEFSTAWGINAIPAVFIVDKKGNLHSTDARGKLDTLIPKLLGQEPG